MNRPLLALLLPGLLAAVPTPLVVGSVRDQDGAAVAGARVRAGATVAQTDADGTFALRAANVRRVTISCAYCEPLVLPVTPEEPVVALVHRYDALAEDSPSERDVASVPYAHAESIAALRPFSVLESTAHALPGPQLSDRGLAPRGMLVLADGIPAYDVATNQSPFVAFPDYAVQHVTWSPPSDAFSYGDLAGGGTLFAQTNGVQPGALLAAGSSRALRAAQTFANGAWSITGSRDRDDARARAGAFLRVPVSDDALFFTAAASADRSSRAAQHLDSSNDGIRAEYVRVRTNRVDASLSADAGGYDGSAARFTYSARWSDARAQAQIATQTRIQLFAGAGLRSSSGSYTTSGGAPPATAGAIAQTQIFAGARTAGERYAAQLGVGAFGMQYAGGAGGAAAAFGGAAVLPSFSGSYSFDPHWTLNVQAGGSFTLPTILEAFVHPSETAALLFDRSFSLVQTIDYGDLRRFRASLTSAAETMSGLDRGTIHAAGVSAAWQVAPQLSLRAWLLRDDDRTQPYETVYRFGTVPASATVSSYWLTYETRDLRLDAIYRCDLLDYAENPHLDFSVSTPLGGRFTIFGASERYAGIRSFRIGLRTQ